MCRVRNKVCHIDTLILNHNSVQFITLSAIQFIQAKSSITVLNFADSIRFTQSLFPISRPKADIFRKEKSKTVDNVEKIRWPGQYVNKIQMIIGEGTGCDVNTIKGIKINLCSSKCNFPCCFIKIKN